MATKTTKLENDLLSLPEKELESLLRKVIDKRKKVSKKTLSELPKKELDSFVKRAIELIEGAEVRRAQPLRLVFNVFDHVVWESDESAHWAGVHLELDAKKSNLGPWMYTDDIVLHLEELIQTSLMNNLQDYDNSDPRTQKKIEEANKKIKRLLEDVAAKEDKLGLPFNFIWDEIHKHV